MQPVFNYIKYPKRLAIGFIKKTQFLYSDCLYLKMRYYLEMNRVLHLRNPKTFNEKLQWLKLYDRNPFYTVLVDKVKVKEFVADVIGEQYIIPTIDVWEHFDDIDFSVLPNKFVLKTNHSGGSTGVVICKDKASFDIAHAKNLLNMSLKMNPYPLAKEWPYKNVTKRIFAEDYIEDSATGELRDYKFFCFNGRVEYFKIDFGRFVEHHANYYDRDGMFVDFGEEEFPRMKDAAISIPNNIKEMILLSEKLAKDIPFVRVDMYNIQGKIFFGELTFFPASGMGKICPEEWDYKLGNMLTLPNMR